MLTPFAETVVPLVSPLEQEPYCLSSFLFSQTKRCLKPSARKAVKKVNAAQMDMPLTYRGESVVLKILVPKSGPHCPIMLSSAIPVPRRVSVPWLSWGDGFKNHSRRVIICMNLLSTQGSIFATNQALIPTRKSRGH